LVGAVPVCVFFFFLVEAFISDNSEIST